MKPKEKGKKIIYILLPAAGTLFFLWYCFNAGGRVIYSDYIRIIDEYLPDVNDLKRMLTPDILTRIPACFFQRIVNVKSFDYSVMFDRICTVAGIALMAGTVAHFSMRHRIPVWAYVSAMAVLFSLAKWEILMNGTCWPHMIAIGLFFVNYDVFDEIWQGEADGLTELIATLMPLVWLLFAGEYIASYAVTMILAAGFGVLTGGAVKVVGRKVQQVFIRIFVMTFLALALYMLSRSYAVWEHAGSTEMTIWELISYAPGFLVKFFAKSFTGAVIGQETLANAFGGRGIPDPAVIAVGFLMIAAYLVALVVYFVSGMNEVTVFPLCLLVSGFINHGLITVARWIFLNENYGLSSRYAGQFMVGLVGLILIAGLYKRPKNYYRRRTAEKIRKTARTVLIAATCLVVAGSLWTTADEIRKMPYRKANYEAMEQMVLDYENHSEEELAQTLEWHKDPSTMLNALKIIKDNRLNVFSKRESILK